MKKTFTSVLVIILTAALLAACGTVPATTQSPAATPTEVTQTAPSLQEPSTLPAVSLEQAYMRVYQAVNPSVVNIQVIQQVSATSSPDFILPGFGPFQSPQTTPTQVEGSGFIYDDQGHIVTNNHVIENAATIIVTFADGSQSSAKLVGADPGSDLAVIKVEGLPSNLKPLLSLIFHPLKWG